MSELKQLCGWLESRLRELPAEYKVPAASFAVYAHGEMIDHAVGVLNKDTGVEATAEMPALPVPDVNAPRVGTAPAGPISG
ncbi:hypothetical protein ACF1BU_05955 [Streptomyces sp. NPDC014724]|uniref:hypothetical protein n=1 Tax=unclassified Streptomyces TaxID=2593676 RepID=UPI003700EE88